MDKFPLLVLDDYEGDLAAPGVARFREIAEVTILDRPLGGEKYDILAGFQVLLALREWMKLDGRFFEACSDLELVLQTGGHAYHLDKSAASQKEIVVALGCGVTKPMVVVPELVFGLMLRLIRKIYPLTTAMRAGEWPQLIGASLAGRTLGILGYG